MPFLQTPPEVAETMADWLGIYGIQDEDHATCNRMQCRVCFVSDMTQRIRDAGRNEQLIAAVERRALGSAAGRGSNE